MRLDQFLQESLLESRKIVRTYIEEGKVFVNNIVTHQPSYEINREKDIVTYLTQQVIHPGHLYYMFHKPLGCITAKKDESLKTVMDYFAEDLRNKLFPVGRLDKDTEGLLLLTNDGDFNNRLMNPMNHVDKTYLFVALGSLDEEKNNLLKSGISLVGESRLAVAHDIKVKACHNYHKINELIENEVLKNNVNSERKEIDDIKFIKNLIATNNIKVNPDYQAIVSGTITISEGRKHQVRRMLKAVGCYVIYLKRLSIGTLNLDDTLDLGEYRTLTIDELNMLSRLE